MIVVKVTRNDEVIIERRFASEEPSQEDINHAVNQIEDYIKLEAINSLGICYIHAKFEEQSKTT